MPTWIDGFEEMEFVGVGARFGPTLESKEKHANQTILTLADPPDCCSPPKNKVLGFTFQLVLLVYYSYSFHYPFRYRIFYSFSRIDGYRMLLLFRKL